MKRLLGRAAVTGALILGLASIAAALPIAHIELSCRSSAPAVAASTPLVSDPGYRRAEGDSYMTYPEWYIVHAYADLAAVTRQSSESGFDYSASVGTFWSSLCGATRTASTIGPVTVDQRVTDYIIGLSFSVEMGTQGLWERTIGAATAWMRGPDKVAEDTFNQRFLDDYAAFLQQRPWYDYPFKSELVRFWHETPFRPSVRSVERRLALSLEYGIKGLYASGIGALAGYDPADLTLMSVVKGPHPGDAAGVTIVRDLGDGRTLVKTPRYAAYTKILRDWAKTDTSVLEIAGNDRILTTVIAPKGPVLRFPESSPIFTIPIQSRPGWERIGLDTHVSSITDLIGAVDRQGAVFEHAYDY